ncbi:MAG: hypothetical protein AB1898_18860 [Acidobacteriota bacterium]
MKDRELLEMESCFRERDYPALVRLLDLSGGPEDGRMGEEFEVRLENLKYEAIKQFDREEYLDSLRTFQFLNQLEPDNRAVQDYLELCRQLTSRSNSTDQVSPNKSGPGEPLVGELDIAEVVTAVPVESLVESPPPALVRRQNVGELLSKSRAALLVRSPRATVNRSSTKRVVAGMVLVAAILVVGTGIDVWRSQRSREIQTTATPADAQTNLQPVVPSAPSPMPAPAPKRPSTKRARPGSGASFSNAVFHDHVFGRCQGVLRIDPQRVSFTPSTGSKDGFAVKPGDILRVKLGKSLEIRLADRTYHFQAIGKNDRTTLLILYQKLTRLSQHPDT